MQIQTKGKRARVPVPKSEVEEHLERQLWLLEKSCRSFDEGDRDEYGRIATAIRVIVYDHNQNRSVLSQLGLKTIPFISYARPIDGRNMLSDSAVVMWRFGSGGGFTLPVLDQGPNPPNQVSFDDWWIEHIFRLPDDTRLSRGDVVLIAANQDGGAHVDPDIDEAFYRIAKKNEAGMLTINSDGTQSQLGDLEKATVRHIGFELIESVSMELQRRVGNNGCTCGSGRKFRYCCGKK